MSITVKELRRYLSLFPDDHEIFGWTHDQVFEAFDPDKFRIATVIKNGDIDVDEVQEKTDSDDHMIQILDPSFKAVIYGSNPWE